MGNLHLGHLRLVQTARSQCRSVITTIFVNPLQFGPNEDFETYPRVITKDSELLKRESVDVVFAPSVGEMYPYGRENQAVVRVPDLTDVLCGADRPGHFDGVTTVVSKLFLLTGADRAYFGEKDWQQLTVIRRMVDQLDFPIEIVGVPTEREEDGLAMSSRNGYLNDEYRKTAPMLFETLMNIRRSVRDGNCNYESLESEGEFRLRDAGFEPDYISIRDELNLQRPETECRKRRVFGAAKLGEARLIDNVSIDT